MHYEICLKKTLMRFIQLLKKWTNNKNDRVRRASCLACMHRKKFGTKNRIVKILKLLEVLMKDDSKYVKKCCGPFVVGYLGYTYPQITLNWLNNQAIKTDENIRWNVAKSFSQALGRRFPHESLNILSKINYNDSKYVKSAIMSSLKKHSNKSSGSLYVKLILHVQKIGVDHIKGVHSMCYKFYHIMSGFTIEKLMWIGGYNIIRF